MAPLPFNFARLATVREAMLWRLLLLPLTCAVAALSVVDVQALADALVPAVEPISPMFAVPATRVAEVIVVMSAFCAATVAYALGWLLTFAVLYGLRHHSDRALFAAFMARDLPPGWEKADAASRNRAAKRNDEAAWRLAHQMGPWRYIVVRGGLLFGTVAFLCLHVALNLIRSQPIVVASLPLKFGLWVLAGVILTAPRWWALKRANRDEA